MNDYDIKNYIFDATEELSGKMIESIATSSEDIDFVFTDKSHYKLYATGDCCSSSWIEHFEDVPKPGEVIQSIKCINMTEEVLHDPTEDGEYIQTYFYDIVTNKGNHVIELRNSSNGYYGGSLDLGKIDD